ncbi:MAG: DUF2520 domain-containing protein, partial [Candidatus Bipolaricaulia bacterium]
GLGIVGTALARGLADAGFEVAAVSSRNQEHVARAIASVPGARSAKEPQGVVDTADTIFLTVSDDAVGDVADSLRWGAGKCAVHCSGTSSINLLDGPREQGAAVGAFHPLQTLASLEQAKKNLPGSAVVIEASDKDLEASLCSMARALGGRPFVLHGDKALYHASAVIACNYLVTLLDAAASLWDHLGLTKEDGLKALLPLVRGTIENLEAVGLPKALTGPVARGDVGTVKRNLKALAEFSPAHVDLYTELARRTIPIARAKGTLSETDAKKLLEYLEGR